MLSRLPVAFVPNLGQWEHPALYVARIGAMTVFLEQKGWAFTLVQRTAEKENENASARGVTVRMTFAGASAPELVAEDRLPGRHNYFLGNHPSKWRSDVPLYRSVRYRDVHGPGKELGAIGRFGKDWQEVYVPIAHDCVLVGRHDEGRPTLDVAAINDASVGLSHESFFAARNSEVERGLAPRIGTLEPMLTAGESRRLASDSWRELGERSS